MAADIALTPRSRGFPKAADNIGSMLLHRYLNLICRLTLWREVPRAPIGGLAAVIKRCSLDFSVGAARGVS
jgi:hypothetical protein